MELPPADLSAIPIPRLVPRRLHLGPFASGRELVKFLGMASVGAAVASVSSAALWLPFLGVGLLVSFVHVEGRTLDDYALGYFRFRWRTSAPPTRNGGGSPPYTRSFGQLERRNASIRTGGIPIAYLPPGDLQRLFEDWRSTLTAVGRPLSICMRGERFSPLPFLPMLTSEKGGEGHALEAYRELVRALLRYRYRRTVELTVGDGSSNRTGGPIDLRTQLDALRSAVERLGIPAEDVAPEPCGSARRLKEPS